MPRGEVYSALAKGVIDGVVAPEDTFRSLHFAEVSKYYTQLFIPRGAYPARAMGTVRWSKLSPAHQAILMAGVPVWEHALAVENRRALEQGRQLAQKEGIDYLSISVADQQRFDTLYFADAERNAKGLERYGIDGLAALAVAQASIGADGKVSCDREERD